MTVLYSNNFDLETLGTLPSGWTNVRGTFTVQIVGSSSGQCLRTTSSSGADNQLVLYTGTSTADGTVSGSFVMGSTQDGVDPAYRFDTGGLNGYIWDIGFSGTSIIATLYNYSGGSASAVGATAGGLGTWAAGTILRWEARFEGSTHELRVWPATTSRPSSPSATRTSNAKTTTGYAGGRWRANGTPVGLDNFSLADLATPPIDEVIPNDIAGRRVFQRMAGGTAKSIAVSGSLGGAAITVEERAVAVSGGTEVVPWTTMTVAGSSYSGTLTSVPQGGWYRREVRGKNGSGTIIATGTETTFWGVGILTSLLGQSNMEDMFNGAIPGTPPTADDLTACFVNGAWVTPPAYAGVRIFLNTVREGVGNIPVAAICYALSSTGLVSGGNTGSGYWLNESSAPYKTFADAVASPLLGGDFEAVFWRQGENECAIGVSTAEYRSGLDTLYSRILALTSRTTAQLPFFVAPVGRMSYGGSTAARVSAVRIAQLQFVGLAGGTATDGAKFAGEPIDVPLHDSVHDNAAGIEQMARRYAQSFLAHLGVVTKNACGPVLSSVSRSGATITLYFDLNGGTALAAESGDNLTGFEVSANDFASLLTISSATITDTTQVTLTLSADPGLGAIVKVRHGYAYGGQTSDGNWLYDNATGVGGQTGFPATPTAMTLTEAANDFIATIGASLPSLGASAAGAAFAPNFNSSVAAALPALTAAATVTHTTMHTGSANVSLPSLLASASGWATIYDEVDAVLPALAAGAVGTFKRLFAWVEKPPAATVWDEVEPA